MAFLDFLSPIFGSKPQIADYTPVDLSDEQLKAISANIDNFPEFQKLGNLYQQFMLSQYESAIPGFRDILKMGGETTKQMLDVSSQELAGEIPKDVQEAVQRSSAFQSLMGGTAGSGMAKALTARDLGLTSLDLTQRGAQMAGAAGNAAQRWAGLAQAGGPEGMLVTTQQQANLDMQQNLIKRNIQQQKYNVEAAPDPVAKGLSDIVMYLTGQYLGSMGGGGMGGGGGGGLPTAGNAPATSAAGSIQDTGGFPASGYSKDTGGGSAMPQTAINWGGTSTAGTTSYNPYSNAPPNVWDSYAYQSNFTG